MGVYITDLEHAGQAMLGLAGGKAANLGELCRINGVSVPKGFCVTTKAYKETIRQHPALELLIAQLNHLSADDREGIGEVSEKIRSTIIRIPVPAPIVNEVLACLTTSGVHDAYAVRSSATAEDLPTASFAGQQDTYLNITGGDAILQHISKCWASLFTERAVAYRIQNGFDHRKVTLAVIVQKMIFPEAAGVLFTANPVNGNRKELSIDASFGLGEALVAGLVNADNYTVRGGRITSKKIATKKLAIYAVADGGTKQQDVASSLQGKQALTDVQILQLEQLGRKIEQHFGTPQDIEWCLARDVFYIVQSRPITTLYPIPPENDNDNHVYISVGHQQMMTDAMRPLGIAVWQMTTPRPMSVAGGRLFVDVAKELASPGTRNMIVNVLGKSDPLIKEALTTIIERDDFIQLAPDENEDAANKNKSVPQRNFQTLTDFDPAIVTELISQSETHIQELKHTIREKNGIAVMDCIEEDIAELKQNTAQSQSFAVIMSGMNAATWINEKMNEWLGETNVADTLSQSVANNITSEMGLALMDVADVVRPFPEVVGYLKQATEENLLEGLTPLHGGRQAKDAILAFLDKYGMRCAGEIDITNARWSEKPATLIPIILTNVRQFEPGAGKRKFEQGLKEARAKEEELLTRLEQLPDGAQKVAETKRMIGLVRNLSGYREYPKYAIINRYYIYKQALLKEAEQLVEAGVLRAKEDIYYLSFHELRSVIETGKVDYTIIHKREEAYNIYKKLIPPRVFTSEGEVMTGTYKRENIPAGAIVGLPVSSGIVEGRARVILNMSEADLDEEDILVTTFTDPSWTPLFVSIKGLVTEVGGLMTHGAVIAREYGLPAVVGVERATKLIKDGQRIRVNGRDGYIEIL